MVNRSVAVRNAQLDAAEATIGASAKLLIYTGTKPTACSDAATGDLLATIDLPSDWMADASGGVKAKSGTWSVDASGTGTAGYYRITATDGTTCGEQGSITATGGGGDLILQNTSIASGQTITISTYSWTAGNP